MMCVLESNQGNLNGAQRRQLELINCISQNYRINILGEKRDEFCGKANISLIEADMKKGDKKTYKAAWFFSGWNNRRRIRVHKKDIAIAWGSMESAIFLWLYGLRNIVCCNRDNPLDYQNLNGAIRTKYLKKIYLLIMEIIEIIICKKIIVQCEYDKKRMINRHKFLFAITKRKVYVQINNINVSWTNYKIENRSRSDVFTIAFISSFVDSKINHKDRKGNFLLFPVVKKMLDEGKKIRLLVAGDGEGLEEYRLYYKGFDDIVFMGFCNSYEVFAKADISVTPSLIDSCPNSLLESLAYGIPSYGANNSGIKDILMDEEYMFETTEEGLYIFLSEIYKSQRWKRDCMRQDSIRERLSFDWGREMIKKIL